MPKQNDVKVTKQQNKHGQRRTRKFRINLTLQVHSLAHDNIQYIMPIYAKKELSHFILNFNVMQFHSKISIRYVYIHVCACIPCLS